MDKRSAPNDRTGCPGWNPTPWMAATARPGENRRVASRPGTMGQVLGIVYRAIVGHLTKKAGFTRKRARTGAVTLIQRFGSALNLNVHFHMLFLDGVYVSGPMERSSGFAR